MRRIEVGPLARHTLIIDGIRHAERQSRKAGRDHQKGLKMTAIQAHYVQYLVRASRGMAMSTLAAHTRTSAANITQVVTRMERHGLVQREPSIMDGRSVVVKATAYGIHQFWRLVRALRKIEAGYRADAVAKPARTLHRALRRIGGPPERLVPDPSFRLRPRRLSLSTEFRRPLPSPSPY